MTQTAKTISFKPRARIIRTIGDQLISGPEAAVIELVKNAYDADASAVTIKFVPPLKSGFGRIIVSDDGHGMSVEEVLGKWMEPATTSKLDRRTTRKGRRMLGSKGIGRFAAAKLGRKMALLSVSGKKGERREAIIPELDWSVFNEDRYLSDIEIAFLDQRTDAATGTIIEISELSEAWSRERMEQLIIELRRLVSPIQAQSDQAPFHIFMDLSECTGPTCGFDGPALLGGPGKRRTSTEPTAAAVEVRPVPVLASSDYLVEGFFDPDGTFHGFMEIRRAGQSPTPIDLHVPMGEDEAPCGRVEVHLSLFDREAEVIRETMKRAGLGELNAAKARQLLDETAGISIYRDGFRVRPYGSLENDWLALDSRRVQDPSLRIGYNQVAGFLTVESQTGSRLVERSSREGFEENAAFRRLRRLIIELLTKVVEPRRQQFRIGAGLSRRPRTSFEEIEGLAELRKIRKLISALPAEKRTEAEAVINREAARLQHQIEQLKDRQRVLEAKSSLGLIVGEILHEGAPDANFVAVSASRLLGEWKYVSLKGPRSDEAREDFPPRLELIAASGDRLRTLFQNLRPLAGGRRTPAESFNMVNVIEETAGIFDSHSVAFDIQPPAHLTELFGHREDLATALLNLFSNAIYWLEQSKTAEASIHVSSSWVGDEVSIMVEDNGPGVPEEFADSIFDIRFTLKEGGTGLGLNIAQEALARSGARLLFHPEHHPGARFEVRFPRYKGSTG